MLTTWSRKHARPAKKIQCWFFLRCTAITSDTKESRTNKLHHLLTCSTQTLVVRIWFFKSCKYQQKKQCQWINNISEIMKNAWNSLTRRVCGSSLPHEGPRPNKGKGFSREKTRKNCAQSLAICNGLADHRPIGNIIWGLISSEGISLLFVT